MFNLAIRLLLLQYLQQHLFSIVLAKVFTILAFQEQSQTPNDSSADVSYGSEMKSPAKAGRQPESSKKALFITPPAVEPKSLWVEPGAFAQPKMGKYSRLRQELSSESIWKGPESLHHHGG